MCDEIAHAVGIVPQDEPPFEETALHVPCALHLHPRTVTLYSNNSLTFCGTYRVCILHSHADPDTNTPPSPLRNDDAATAEKKKSAFQKLLDAWDTKKGGSTQATQAATDLGTNMAFKQMLRKK